MHQLEVLQALRQIKWRLDFLVATQIALATNQIALNLQGARMANVLDVLVSQVEKTISVEQSAIVLIQGIAAKVAELAANAADPAAVNKLASDLQASAAALADAVAANQVP